MCVGTEINLRKTDIWYMGVDARVDANASKPAAAESSISETTSSHGTAHRRAYQGSARHFLQWHIVQSTIGIRGVPRRHAALSGDHRVREGTNEVLAYQWPETVPLTDYGGCSGCTAPVIGASWGLALGRDRTRQDRELTAYMLLARRRDQRRGQGANLMSKFNLSLC